jgi:protein gp37
MANRFSGRFGYPVDDPFRPGEFHPHQIEKLLAMMKPKVIFMGSMGDMFHDKVKDWPMANVLLAMMERPQHQYILLTKNPHKMVKVLSEFARLNGGEIPANWWPGVSAWDQDSFDKNVGVISTLESPNRWVSLEPLLDPVDLSMAMKPAICPACGWIEAVSDGGDGYMCPYCDLEPHWPEPLVSQVVVGGETGQRARPVHHDYLTAIRDECKEAGVSFMFKGWGEWAPCNHLEADSKGPVMQYGPGGMGSWDMFQRVGKAVSGRLLDGVEHNELAWRGNAA